MDNSPCFLQFFGHTGEEGAHVSDQVVRVLLNGTAKTALPTSRSPRPDERGVVDVYLRRRAPLADVTSYGRTRPFLSRAEFARLHGARAEDVLGVRDFASAYGLDVVSVDETARRVRLSGSWDALGKAFGTSVVAAEVDGKTIHRNVTDISLPASLAPAIDAVMGLDTTPWIPPHGTFSSGSNTLTVADVVAQYQFPTTTPSGAACDGAGETVTLLQFDATFDIVSFQTYFQFQGLPAPACSVRTDLLTSMPSGGGNGEAMLDAHMVGLAAPGAKIVLWLSNSFSAAQTMLAAITAATHDATEPATVLSM